MRNKSHLVSELLVTGLSALMLDWITLISSLLASLLTTPPATPTRSLGGGADMIICQNFLFQILYVDLLNLNWLTSLHCCEWLKRRMGSVIHTYSPHSRQWVPGPVMSAMFATWRQHNCLQWSQLTCNIIMWCRTLLLLSRLISTVMNKFHSCKDFTQDWSKYVVAYPTLKSYMCMCVSVYSVH